MKNKDLLLNHVYLKNRIQELGLKQWWLAEQVGVDRKTVVRWVQGKVKSIQVANAHALAKVLECGLNELKVEDESEQLATPEDQRQAASLLTASSIAQKLGPIGEWNVIEALLKATLVPGLPLNILGEMYDQLTIASWRQSKMGQAEIYNKKTEEIALKTKDQSLYASALQSRAHLLSWRGATQQSIQTYRECLKLEKYLNPKMKGSVLSNLGAVLFESGELEEGDLQLAQALESFAIEGRPQNFSIAWCHRALIALEQGDLSKAKDACEKSVQFALQDDYRRGLFMGELIRAEIQARQGSPSEAQSALTNGLRGFEQLRIEEGLHYEFAGRVNRLLGEHERSLQDLNKGLSVSGDFPLSRAALHLEKARTLLATGSPPKESETHALEAEKLYLKCEAPRRARVARALLSSTS